MDEQSAGSALVTCELGGLSVAGVDIEDNRSPAASSSVDAVPAVASGHEARGIEAGLVVLGVGTIGVSWLGVVGPLIAVAELGKGSVSVIAVVVAVPIGIGIAQGGKAIVAESIGVSIDISVGVSSEEIGEGTEELMLRFNLKGDGQGCQQAGQKKDFHHHIQYNYSNISKIVELKPSNKVTNHPSTSRGISPNQSTPASDMN